MAQATGEAITKQDGSTWESGPKRAEGREAGRRWGPRWEHWACPAEACGPEETGKYGWECSLYDRRVSLHRGTGMTWNDPYPKPSPSRVPVPWNKEALVPIPTLPLPRLGEKHGVCAQKKQHPVLPRDSLSRDTSFWALGR